MPLWNSSNKDKVIPPATVTMDKATTSVDGGEPRDIKRAYEFKEVLGTYVSVRSVLQCFLTIVVLILILLAVQLGITCTHHRS